MKLYKTGSPEFLEKIESLLGQRERLLDQIGPEVDQSIRDYRRDREDYLIRSARDFDGVNLSEEELWVDAKSIKNAHKFVSSEIRLAIEHAKSRIEKFQGELRLTSFHSEEETGIFWGTEVRPLDRVGIYIPGGRANYFLTLLLCGVSARAAGVSELIVATPPKRKLESPYVDPTLLYAAKLLDISKILLAGSVAGISALAFGTKKTKPVDKVVGSGGKRTAVAKARLSGYVGNDGLVGPSETSFICDQSSESAFVAADIIGKADRDPDAEILVFHTSEKGIQNLIERLVQEMELIKDSAAREGIRAALSQNTYFFQVSSIEEAIGYVNQLASGTVSLAIKNAVDYLNDFKACGSLLLGPYTPPVGLDLIGGPSGVVSTLGSARFSLSMSPVMFVRRFSVMEFDKNALERQLKEAECLAKEEGFSTHQHSYRVRFEDRG